MAHDSVSLTSPTSADKPAEHPARAIMAKRWEERRAEARARRIAELKLGDSGLIALASLPGAAAANGREAMRDTLEPSSAPAVSDDATAHGFKKSASVSKPAAVSGEIVDVAATPAAPAPAVQSQAITPAPSWLRDSRKAMLIVAVVSNGVLLALLYFGGFLG